MPKAMKGKLAGARIAKYGDFRGGGLNLAASEVYLKPSEYADCKNTIYERNGGRLRTLEPLELVLTAAGTITGMFHSLNYGLFFACGQSLYRVVNGIAVSVGTLNGAGAPQFCDWGEESEKRVYIASGSIIQWYDGSNLQTQTPQPMDPNQPSGDKWNSASDVAMKEGRLLLVRSGKDRLKFTGIGDPDNWQVEDINNGNDDIDVHTDADAQWVDIGYKQGGNIIKVAWVSRDLFIFRSDGTLYRMTGNYPDWVSMQVGQQVSPINQESIVSIGEDIMFVDRDRGLRKVSAVEDAYNDLAITEKEGEKINSWLAAHVTSSCRAWSLPDRGEVWIRPNATNTVLTYSNRYGGWNKLDIGYPINAACEADGVVYLAYGSKLCKLNDGAVAAAVDIRPAMSLSFAPVFSNDRVISEWQKCRIQKDAGATAALAISGNSWSLSNGRNVRHQLLINDSLSPVLTSSGGTVVLDEFEMTTSEAV